MRGLLGVAAAAYLCSLGPATAQDVPKAETFNATPQRRDFDMKAMELPYDVCKINPTLERCKCEIITPQNMSGCAI